MWIISKKKFVEAATKFPNQREAIMHVYKTLKQARFNSPDEMRLVFKSLDNFSHKNKWWVIDIGGNSLRMIAYIQFTQNRLFVKYIVTHTEYDRLTARYKKGEL
jgi:mRNA interferase HigB